MLLKHKLFLLFFSLIALVVSVLTAINYPFWWDEGWNLSVAKNWALHGLYARQLMGVDVMPRLINGFVVVAMPALSFKFFGIGLIQARLGAMFVTLLSLIVVYLFVKKIANSATALLALLFLLILNSHLHLNFFIIGSQVLGEMPSFLFVAIGFWALSNFLSAKNRNFAFYFLLTTLISWALAFSIKLQVQPFILASILATALLLFFYKDYRKMWGIIALLILVPGAYLLLKKIELGLLIDPSLINSERSEPVKDLYQSTALVFNRLNQLRAWELIYKNALLTLIGFILTLGILIKELISKKTDKEIINFISLTAFFTFGFSWLAWFLIFSVGWPRHASGPVWVGTILLAISLNKLWQYCETTFRDFKTKLLTPSKKIGRTEFAGLIFIIVLALAGITANKTGGIFSLIFQSTENITLEKTAKLINSSLPQDQGIETYNTELFFLLNTPYHFPPDQLHVSAIKNQFLSEKEDIYYDAIPENINVIVVGPIVRTWHIYDSLIAENSFKKVQSIGAYEIFERQR